MELATLQPRKSIWRSSGSHERIIALRTADKSIVDTARLAQCSASQVKRVWAMAKAEGARLELAEGGPLREQRLGVRPDYTSADSSAGLLRIRQS